MTRYVRTGTRCCRPVAHPAAQWTACVRRTKRASLQVQHLSAKYAQRWLDRKMAAVRPCVCALSRARVPAPCSPLPPAHHPHLPAPRSGPTAPPLRHRGTGARRVRRARRRAPPAHAAQRGSPRHVPAGHRASRPRRGGAARRAGGVPWQPLLALRPRPAGSATAAAAGCPPRVSKQADAHAYSAAPRQLGAHSACAPVQQPARGGRAGGSHAAGGGGRVEGGGTCREASLGACAARAPLVPASRRTTGSRAERRRRLSGRGGGRRGSGTSQRRPRGRLALASALRGHCAWHRCRGRRRSGGPSARALAAAVAAEQRRGAARARRRWQRQPRLPRAADAAAPQQRQFVALCDGCRRGFDGSCQRCGTSGRRWIARRCLRAVLSSSHAASALGGQCQPVSGGGSSSGGGGGGGGGSGSRSPACALAAGAARVCGRGLDVSALPAVCVPVRAPPRACLDFFFRRACISDACVSLYAYFPPCRSMHVRGSNGWCAWRACAHLLLSRRACIEACRMAGRSQNRKPPQRPRVRTPHPTPVTAHPPP